MFSLIVAAITSTPVQPVGAAKVARSAIFCRDERGDPSQLALRLLANGNLKFGISKWEGSQFFGLYGVARRIPGGWIYVERDPYWEYSQAEQTRSHVGRTRIPPVTCKATITWTPTNHISFDVDEHANCEDDAGVGFLHKSAKFGPADLRGAVTFQLVDAGTFFSARADNICRKK